MNNIKTYCKVYGTSFVIVFYLLLIVEAPVKIICLIAVTLWAAIVGAAEEIGDSLYLWERWLFGMKINWFGIKSHMKKNRDIWRNKNLIYHEPKEAPNAK